MFQDDSLAEIRKPSWPELSAHSRLDTHSEMPANGLAQHHMDSYEFNTLSLDKQQCAIKLVCITVEQFQNSEQGCKIKYKNSNYELYIQIKIKK